MAGQRGTRCPPTGTVAPQMKTLQETTPSLLNIHRPAWVVSTDLSEIIPNRQARRFIDSQAAPEQCERFDSSPESVRRFYHQSLLDAVRATCFGHGFFNGNPHSAVPPDRVTCSVHGRVLELLVMALHHRAPTEDSKPHNRPLPAAWLLVA